MLKAAQHPSDASLTAKALAGLLHGADFEGYILLIALALLIQALLTLATLPQLGHPRRPAR